MPHIFEVLLRLLAVLNEGEVLFLQLCEDGNQLGRVCEIQLRILGGGGGAHMHVDNGE